METRLIGQSLVLLAKSFNPTITTQIWLDENRIVLRDEYALGSVFTDVMTQAITKKFLLLLTHDQLQLSPAPGEQLTQSLLLERVGRFIACLPHTPFYALGLNFNWQYQPQDSKIADRTRAFFFDASNAFQSRFNTPETKFGGYFSLPFGKSRLKLDVKPAMIDSLTSGQAFEAIHYSFNFHFDLGPGVTATRQIIEALETWDICHHHSQKIVEESCQLQF